MQLDNYSGALIALALVVIASAAYVLLASAPQPQEPQGEAPSPQNQSHGPSPPQDYSPPSCSQIGSCTPGDGCCPEGCTALLDYDCPAPALGETLSAPGLTLQVSFVEERRCIGFSDNEDYIYYLVFHANIKNTLNRSQFVSYPSFYLLDTAGAKYDPDPVLPHYTCRDNYQELLLETKYLQPNQTVSGEVWIEIDKEEDPLDGTLRLVYDPVPAEPGEEFIYSFNYSG